MKVSLFIPCLVDNLSPTIGEAAAKVLAAAGCEVSYPPGQTCCGQPAYNSGYREEARRVARNFIRVFEGEENIVCPSGSCVSMVRNHYPGLFATSVSDLEAAERVCARVFEFSEFLVDRLGVLDLGSSFSGKVTYHDSCHLNRELGIKDAPRALLKAVRGLELIEMEDSDRCCGFGGTFSMKFPEVSTAMADRKVDRIAKSGAEAVVACDPGCLLQMGGRLSRLGSDIRAFHLAEILASGL